MKPKSHSGKAGAPVTARPPHPPADADCPVRRLMQKISEMRRLEALADNDHDLRSLEKMNNIGDQIDAIEAYAVTLRAASLEGAFFQLGLIADKLYDFDSEKESEIEAAHRTMYRLIFSIAGVLAKHAPSAAGERAIIAHLPSYLDPQTFIEKIQDGGGTRDRPFGQSAKQKRATR